MGFHFCARKSAHLVDRCNTSNNTSRTGYCAKREETLRVGRSRDATIHISNKYTAVLCCYALNDAIQRPCTEWRQLSDILGDREHCEGKYGVGDSSLGHCDCVTLSLVSVGVTTVASSWQQRIPLSLPPRLCTRLGLAAGDRTDCALLLRQRSSLHEPPVLPLATMSSRRRWRLYVFGTVCCSQFEYRRH